jgi:amidohydrolase
MAKIIENVNHTAQYHGNSSATQEVLAIGRVNQTGNARMPILNRANELQEEVTAWRRHLHQNPEILYDVFDTAAFVSTKLQEFGVDEIVAGLGQTGVVGLIHGKGKSSKVIGLRADMDALPIVETSGKEWASLTSGKMHACGHDGHTAMLLGAAKYLAETRNFDGSIAVIFQPAEEGGGGALAMIEDGLVDRFKIDEFYGMHNMPGIPLGQFAMRKGGIMAAPDKFSITVHGRGGHAAQPHKTIDPIAIGAQIISNLQLIGSRNVDPVHAVVVSVTQFHAGSSHNIIPDTAEIIGTVRTLDEDTRNLAEQKLIQIAQSIATAHGAKADAVFNRFCPVTVNHPNETDFAYTVAAEIVGDHNVDADVEPSMAGEDFSYMLNAKPGCYIFVGNGPSAGLHNPNYDFADEAIAYGISYWVRLVEKRLPLSL